MIQWTGHKGAVTFGPQRTNDPDNVSIKTILIHAASCSSICKCGCIVSIAVQTFDKVYKWLRGKEEILTSTCQLHQTVVLSVLDKHLRPT